MTKTEHNKPAANNPATPLFAKDYTVYINHTDAGGIVYHANHLVFFEHCRRDWFTQLGLNAYFLQTDNGDIQHFVVSQADLQYKRAILLDEVISVRIDTVELKPASIVFHQSIHRHTADTPTADSKAIKATDNKATDNKVTANDSLLSRTKIVIACVQNQVRTPAMPHDDLDNAVASAAPMRPIRIPQKLRAAIEQAMSEHL